MKQPTGIFTKEVKPAISVCLCTYMRKELLSRCLEGLLDQDFSRSFEVVIVDNDTSGSAKQIYKTFKSLFQERGIGLKYDMEPEQNISLARNRSVANSSGVYLAFIDDDEIPDKDWLSNLCMTLEDKNVEGVFGPVFKSFPLSFSSNVIISPLFDDVRRRSTGLPISGESGRTSNALVTRKAICLIRKPFKKELGRSGGEDTELFTSLEDLGCKFCWCDEARVHEEIEPKRIELSYQFRRGYVSGCNRARLSMKRRGILFGLVPFILLVPVAIFKPFFYLFLYYRHPKTALLFFARSVGGQMGKLGFLIRFQLENYKPKKEGKGSGL